MELEDLRQIFEKYSYVKFHGNPSSGSRVVPCGRTDRRTHGQTDMMKFIDAFRNFMNGPKNWVIFCKLNICGSREKYINIVFTFCAESEFLK